MAASVRLDSLKTQRLAAGLSIEAVARKSNTSDQTVRGLESGGSCTEMVAQRIADAMGVSLATLGRAPLG